MLLGKNDDHKLPYIESVMLVTLFMGENDSKLVTF